MWPFGWKMHGRRGLRMWTLSLIARGPKNGAEIVDAIEQMTQGWWRPSPGSIYPLLAELQQEGLVQKRDDGRYELTPRVRDEFERIPGVGRRRPRRGHRPRDCGSPCRLRVPRTRKWVLLPLVVRVRLGLHHPVLPLLLVNALVGGLGLGFVRLQRPLVAVRRGCLGNAPDEV